MSCGITMSLDALTRSVIEAILRVEILKAKELPASVREGYLSVSLCEEESADSLPESDEGAIARER